MFLNLHLLAVYIKCRVLEDLISVIYCFNFATKPCDVVPGHVLECEWRSNAPTATFLMVSAAGSSSVVRISAAARRCAILIT